MLTFPSAPPPTTTTTTTCGTRRKASASSESQPSSEKKKVDSALLYPKSQPTVPLHDVIHTSWSHFLSRVLFWHLWIMHPPSAWTPALMLHLTNPCAKRKVLSITKLKGKIYKPKSLGYYITFLSNSNDLCRIKWSEAIIPIQ